MEHQGWPHAREPSPCGGCSSCTGVPVVVVVDFASLEVGSVDSCIAAIASERRRTDAAALLAWMRESTGLEPRMWGSIVGLGSYRYRYASSRSCGWNQTVFTGFRPGGISEMVDTIELQEAGPTDT